MSGSLLLDTSVVIWILEGSTRISPRARGALFDPSHVLIVSVVSVWEIVLKHQAGKLELTMGLGLAVDTILHDSPWTILPLKAEAILALVDLPSLHRDPFDRVLVSQARQHGLVMVTPDTQIRKYGIPTIW